MMKIMKKILGYAILAATAAGVFAAIVAEQGLTYALVNFGAAIVLAALLIIAVSLIV